MKHWPFKVTDVNNKPKISVEYKGENKTFFPEEISSMVLVKMKEVAEAYLGQVCARKMYCQGSNYYLSACQGQVILLTGNYNPPSLFLLISKMPKMRNARSLVKSIEMPSGLQLAMKGKLFCLLHFEKCIVLRGYNECWNTYRVWRDVKVIQGRVALSKLYVRLTCRTIGNCHNKLLEFLQ